MYFLSKISVFVQLILRNFRSERYVNNIVLNRRFFTHFFNHVEGRGKNWLLQVNAKGQKMVLKFTRKF
jgi:hypothetical protein